MAGPWNQSKYNYNNNEYEDEPYYEYFKLGATVTETVDVDNNQSILEVSVRLYHKNISSVAGNRDVHVTWHGTGGEVVNRISAPSMSGPTSGERVDQFGSTSLIIDHDSSGSASGYITVEWYKNISYHQFDYTELGCKVTNITLTNISGDEPAYLTEVYDFTSEEDEPTIEYVNPMGTGVTALRACISSAEDEYENVLVDWQKISRTATSDFLVIANSEMEALISFAGASRTATVYFIIRTYVGGEYYYDSMPATFTVSIQEGAPEVDVSISKDNSAIPSGTRAQFDNLIIQGKTKLNFTITATPQGDATIEGYSTVVEGVTYTTDEFITPAFSTSGNKTWAATVIDSRAFTGSDRGEITVLPYVKPTITNTAVYRSDAAGVYKKTSDRIWINATRAVSPINSGGRKNYSILSYRYKSVSTQSYGNWITLLGSESSGASDSYSGLISGTFSTGTSYYFQLKLADDIGEETILTFNTASDIVALHLGNTGRAMGIGMYAKTEIANSLSIGWKTYFDSDIYLLVNGQYITLAQYIQSFIS